MRAIPVLVNGVAILGGAWLLADTANAVIASERSPVVEPAPSRPGPRNLDADLAVIERAGIFPGASNEQNRRLIACPVRVAPPDFDVRIVPYFEGGTALGFKLYGLRPGSRLVALGLRNGDVVRSVNGLALNSPEAALAVYERLKDRRVHDLSILREGREETLRVDVR